MATLRIDEIRSPQFDAETYIQTYFRPMRISQERKEEREEASHTFRDTLLFLFALITAYRDYGNIDWEVIETQFRIDFEQAVTRYSRNTPTMQAYVEEKVSDFINTTKEQDLNDPYWTSDERATMEAVNEANDVVGYGELQKAIEAGYKYKTWRTERDNRVRKSHVKMEGKTIPITEYFDLDKGSMLYPHDYFNCPEECPNCRCAAIYSKDGKVTKTDGKVQYTNDNKRDSIEKKRPRFHYDLQFFGDKADHMWDQMDYRDITDDEIMEAMEFPLADPYDYYEIDDKGRPSIKFIGEKVTVAWNPETETQITCWKTPKYLVKRLKNGSKRRGN